MVRRLYHQVRRLFQQRTNLDASFGSLASSWNFLCPLDRFIQVFAVEDVVSRELLFGFGKWAVEDDGCAIALTNGGRGGRRAQRLGAFKDAFRSRFSHDLPVSLGDLLHRFRIRRSLLPGINEQHVTHANPSLCFISLLWRRLRRPISTAELTSCDCGTAAPAVAL